MPKIEKSGHDLSCWARTCHSCEENHTTLILPRQPPHQSVELYLYMCVYVFVFVFVFVYVYEGRRTTLIAENHTKLILPRHAPPRFREKREHLKTYQGLLPESQRQNLALTVLYVSHPLDSGPAPWVHTSHSGGENPTPLIVPRHTPPTRTQKPVVLKSGSEEDSYLRLV